MAYCTLYSNVIIYYVLLQLEEKIEHTRFIFPLPLWFSRFLPSIVRLTLKNVERNSVHSWREAAGSLAPLFWKADDVFIFPKEFLWNNVLVFRSGLYSFLVAWLIHTIHFVCVFTYKLFTVGIQAADYSKELCHIARCWIRRT